MGRVTTLDATSSLAEDVHADLGAAGLGLVEWLTDPDGRFALSLARRAALT
jgi:hypothetical protein